MDLRNLREHFWAYVRGVLRGHPGARIGRGVRLTGPGRYDLRRGSTITDGVRAWVGEGATLTMHRGSKLGDRCVVNVETGLILGRDARVSWDVQLLDTDFHWVRTADGRIRSHTAAIEIGDRVLVGTRAMVLKGVVVGRGAIVGAGAVVRRSVVAGSIVAGNPAEEVGRALEWGSARGALPARAAQDGAPQL